MTSDSNSGSKFNKSKALKLWLIVLVAVLAILFIEISMTKQTAYNVIVITDSILVGKTVFIDSKVAGQVKKANNLGSNTGSICLNLADGKHKLEVKEKSKSLLAKEIVVDGKSLINLKKSSAKKSSDMNPLN